MDTTEKVLSLLTEYGYWLILFVMLERARGRRFRARVYS